MPYPNCHSCRIKNPDQFQQGSFRTMHTGEGDGKFDIIIGRPKGSNKTTAQAYRYDKKIWTESRARAHCKRHGGTFEAAANESAEVNEMDDEYARIDLLEAGQRTEGDLDEEDLLEFAGSPRNIAGTHASAGYPGGRNAWKAAWRTYLQRLSWRTLLGTHRRLHMVAKGMGVDLA